MSGIEDVEGVVTFGGSSIEALSIDVPCLTKSELYRRIAQVLFRRVSGRLWSWRKKLLAPAVMLAMNVSAMGQPAPNVPGQMQGTGTEAKGDNAVTGIVGYWQGTFHTPDGHDLRLVLTISNSEKNSLTATLYSIDQNQPPLAGNSVHFENGMLRFVNQYPGLTYEGKMSADGNSIRGTIEQNGSYPLLFERATRDTAWTIPTQAPRMPAMSADVKPGVEVATIKSSPPDAPRTMLTFRGSEIIIKRMSLNDLIEYAWDVHEKQVLGGPGWMGAEKWDIEAKPDVPGTPSADQLKELVQRLVTERFGLKFHNEKRQMSAYVLTLGKDAPKMTKSAVQSGRAGFSVGPGGLIRMHDASMVDFAAVLQRTTLDRPVVDQTGLDGHWDFVLRWLPDESQFGGQVEPPPPDDPAASLPPLPTAMQEQLGLNLGSHKAEVSVLIIDHVDQPSPN